MRKLLAVLGLLTLLIVLACSPSEGRTKESFPSSSVTNQDDGGFSRLVERAVAAAPMAPLAPRGRCAPKCKFSRR